MPYTKYATANRCDGWWDCLSSAEQTAIIVGSGIGLAMILASLILARGMRKSPPAEAEEPKSRNE
jgi:hypothetical protein